MSSRRRESRLAYSRFAAFTSISPFIPRDNRGVFRFTPIDITGEVGSRENCKTAIRTEAGAIQFLSQPQFTSR